MDNVLTSGIRGPPCRVGTHGGGHRFQYSRASSHKWNGKAARGTGFADSLGGIPTTPSTILLVLRVPLPSPSPPHLTLSDRNVRAHHPFTQTSSGWPVCSRSAREYASSTSSPLLSVPSAAGDRGASTSLGVVGRGGETDPKVSSERSLFAASGIEQADNGGGVLAGKLGGGALALDRENTRGRYCWPCFGRDVVTPPWRTGMRSTGNDDGEKSVGEEGKLRSGRKREAAPAVQVSTPRVAVGELVVCSLNDRAEAEAPSTRERTPGTDGGRKREERGVVRTRARGEGEVPLAEVGFGEETEAREDCGVYGGIRERGGGEGERRVCVVTGPMCSVLSGLHMTRKNTEYTETKRNTNRRISI